jgi:ubiquinone/menaquinone biosynthesis C-methylase UbiE
MKLDRIEKKIMTSRKHVEYGINHVERLSPYVEMNKHQKYLEVGCGNGHVCIYVAKTYKLEVTGTDIDPDMIQMARERSTGIPHIRFMQMDATVMPFEDNEFDIALSFGVLHHIGTWKKALAEIQRVLKPQGIYILSDLAYPRILSTILSPLVKKYGIYTIDDIIDWLEPNGFEIIHRESPSGILFPHHDLVLRNTQ